MMELATYGAGNLSPGALTSLSEKLTCGVQTVVERIWVFLSIRMKNKHICIYISNRWPSTLSQENETWCNLINISVTVASSVSITVLSRGRMEEWGENLEWQYQQGDDLLRMLAHSYKSNLCTGLWGPFWVTTADLRGLFRKFVERKMTFIITR